jgi:hypothetical protein
VKIREIGLDRFYRFLINRLVNLIFLNFVFFKKNGLPVLVPVTDQFTSFSGFQPLSVDRFIGFDTGLTVVLIGKSVILTGLLILDFSNAKFKFRALFD